MQTGQGAGVPAGRREGPVRPKEGSKFYGVGVEACGEPLQRRGLLVAFKTFSPYENTTCLVQNAEKAQESSKGNKNKIEPLEKIVECLEQ